MDRRLIFATALLVMCTIITGLAYVFRPQPERRDKLIVVASFYPLAYMVRQIGGDMVEVRNLIQPGIEVHSWQPTAGDLVDASDADILVANGAGLDSWVQDDIIPVIDMEGKIFLDTTQNLTLWMNVEQSEVQEHGVYDPHTWVSPYEAWQQADAIYKAVIEKDPAHVEYYHDNWNTFSAKLRDLDMAYRSQLQNHTSDTIFVTHDAFGYLARRYGFEQQGIVGLSADQQPSTQTIIDIVELMKRTETYTFYLEPGYSDAYVQTIKMELQSGSEKDVEILRLYHMNGPLEGLDYLQQLERNLVNLKKGLGS